MSRPTPMRNTSVGELNRFSTILPRRRSCPPEGAVGDDRVGPAVAANRPRKSHRRQTSLDPAPLTVPRRDCRHRSGPDPTGITATFVDVIVRKLGVRRAIDVASQPMRHPASRAASGTRAARPRCWSDRTLWSVRVCTTNCCEPGPRADPRTGRCASAASGVEDDRLEGPRATHRPAISFSAPIRKSIACPVCATRILPL